RPRRRAARERSDRLPQRQQPLRNVPAGVAEGPCDDAKFPHNILYSTRLACLSLRGAKLFVIARAAGPKQSPPERRALRYACPERSRRARDNGRFVIARPAGPWQSPQRGDRFAALAM